MQSSRNRFQLAGAIPTLKVKLESSSILHICIHFDFESVSSKQRVFLQTKFDEEVTLEIVSIGYGGALQLINLYVEEFSSGNIQSDKSK